MRGFFICFTIVCLCYDCALVKGISVSELARLGPHKSIYDKIKDLTEESTWTCKGSMQNSEEILIIHVLCGPLNASRDGKGKDGGHVFIGNTARGYQSIVITVDEREGRINKIRDILFDRHSFKIKKDVMNLFVGEFVHYFKSMFDDPECRVTIMQESTLDSRTSITIELPEYKAIEIRGHKFAGYNLAELSYKHIQGFIIYVVKDGGKYRFTSVAPLLCD